MRSVATLALIALGWLASGPAAAGPVGTPPVLSVSASSGDGSDAINLAVPTVPNPDGVTYNGTGHGETANLFLDFNLNVNPDPEIGGSFTLTNRSDDELAFSLSFALPIAFAPTSGSASGSFGPATFSDAGGDPLVRVAVDPAPFYRAILGTTTIASLGDFDLTAFGGSGVFGTISAHSFAGPLPGGITPGPSTLTVSFGRFTLSARDSLFVPFAFIVVPEPSLAWLVGLGVLALAGVRARG